MIERQIKLYGRLAQFNRPESKILRVTYDVPTPSALRNILEAIYFKRTEFRYEITGITVLNPIRKMDMFGNEIKSKVDVKDCLPINRSGFRGDKLESTQRQTNFLVDVAYLVDFRIVLLDDYRPWDSKREECIASQFDNRLEHGKCFYQPYFGMRECVCYFEKPDGTEKPHPEVGSKKLGFMVYDLFDPRTNGFFYTGEGSDNTAVFSPSYYQPEMVDGYIRVPDYDSVEVLKSNGLNGMGVSYNV